MAAAAGTLFGRYRVAGVLGRGASSIVYRAEDPATGAPFAIKALREELLVDGERDATLRRFRREAAIGRELDHPRIARLYDMGEREGLPWLAFEFVSGEPMDALIRRAPLPPAQVARLGIGLLDALAHAHTRHVVHRDVKPANVMLRAPEAEPVLMDFGIARVDGSALTGTGEVLGSPAYLAPEVLRGERTDHRADLFAVGVLLYQAVTGQRPFGGTVAEVLHRICYVEPLPPSAHVPGAAGFDAVLARAMAKQPDARFPDAAAFAEALQPLCREAAPAPAVVPRGSGPVAAQPVLPVSAAQLRAALAERVGGEITADGLGELGALIARVPPAECAAASSAVLAEGVRPLVAWLAAAAPDPQGAGVAGGDWLAAAGVMQALLALLRGQPEAREADAAVTDLAQDVAARALLFGDALSQRLAAADEAPDLQELAFGFLNLDALCFCLDSLGAERERRLVEAAALLAVAGVLRKAAALMRRYVETRDPLIRFDVLNLLLRSEDLIGLAGRVAAPAVGQGRSAAAFAQVGEDALADLIRAIAGLVGAVGEELVTAATDPAGLDETLARLRQLQLVHRFASRLDMAAFRDALSGLSGQVHELFSRLGEVLLALPDDADARRRIGVLHDMAAELGWHDLARRLLAGLRRRIAAPHDTATGDAA